MYTPSSSSSRKLGGSDIISRAPKSGGIQQRRDRWVLHSVCKSREHSETKFEKRITKKTKNQKLFDQQKKNLKQKQKKHKSRTYSRIFATAKREIRTPRTSTTSSSPPLPRYPSIPRITAQVHPLHGGLEELRLH